MRALITGLAGPRLGAAEAEFLRRVRPCGIILFARNLVSLEQIAALVAAQLKRENRAQEIRIGRGEDVVFVFFNRKLAQARAIIDAPLSGANGPLAEIFQV